MNYIDRRIAELRAYRTPATAQPDLEAFWQRTIETYRSKPLNAALTRVEAPTLATADVYELTYEGFDDTRVHGWYIRPAERSGEKLPCIVSFHGYPGEAGYPEQHAGWLASGFAVLALESRGQLGRTGSRLPLESGHVKGFMSQNIMDKEQCYFRAILVDAMRGIDWAAERPDIDHDRIAAFGGSQGGGLTLAMAAISGKLRAAVADIPNLCHLDYAIYHSQGSISEIAQYCSHYPDRLGQVLETLSYFDMLNLADRIAIPTMVSVAFKDPICPPETIFPVFERIASPVKELKMYPFIGHSVMPAQRRQGAEFLLKHLAPRGDA